MKDKLKEIKEKIEISAQKSGRIGEDITLIAVSKTYPVEAINKAIELGLYNFGENKVQELIGKIELINEPVKWHQIGHLQTNKVKYIVGKTDLIHSVDSMKLATEIERQSKKANCITNVLIEVNVANEESKHGIMSSELISFVKEVSKLENIRVKGLMTVAPFVIDPEDNRPIFRKLYELSVDIQKQKFDNVSSEILSMGMSNDYTVAIEEGATMVRIGTAIFGNRDYTK